jgi:hypothetical protein
MDAAVAREEPHPAELDLVARPSTVIDRRRPPIQSVRSNCATDQSGQAA